MISILMVLVALFLLARHWPFLLEQPGSSLMRFHPRFSHLELAALDLILQALRLENGADEVMVQEDARGLSSLTTWMACFGADHAKLTELCCSEIELISPLFRSLSAEQKATLRGNVTTVDEIVVTSSGRVLRKVTGQKVVLRGTQVYPKEYGRAVFRSWRRWKSFQTVRVDPEVSDSDCEQHTADWPDACLAPVLSEFSSVTRCPRVW